MNEDEDTKELCGCGNNPKAGEHACPYKVEIHGDYETCTCCDDCEYECCMDI